MCRLLWICLGGALGSGLRYLVSGWVLRLFGPRFPSGTLAVNAVGSLVLGATMYVGEATELMSPTIRLAVTIGVLGGFTTYSTFSWETMRMIQESAWGLAAVNVATTVVVCLVASFAGLAAGRWLVGG